MSAASKISSPVGVIAGGGAMPFAVADSLAARGIAPVCSPSKAPAIRSGSRAFVTTGFRSVRSAGRKNCSAARVPRPHLHRHLVAAGAVGGAAGLGTIRVLGRVMAAFRGGDDHLLSGIGRILEQDGFRMVGIRMSRPISDARGMHHPRSTGSG
jgi:Uncharacterized protein conserved in bacteria